MEPDLLGSAVSEYVHWFPVYAMSSYVQYVDHQFTVFYLKINLNLDVSKFIRLK